MPYAIASEQLVEIGSFMANQSRPNSSLWMASGRVGKSNVTTAAASKVPCEILSAERIVDINSDLEKQHQKNS